jgi:hypothetical protein
VNYVVHVDVGRRGTAALENMLDSLRIFNVVTVFTRRNRRIDTMPPSCAGGLRFVPTADIEIILSAVSAAASLGLRRYRRVNADLRLTTCARLSSGQKDQEVDQESGRAVAAPACAEPYAPPVGVSSTFRFS